MAVDLRVIEFVLVNHMELRVLPLNRGRWPHDVCNGLTHERTDCGFFLLNQRPTGTIR
ncbi:MAG: hypothetical protein V3R85_08325 [Alphaproteobacteria bacterium]